MQDVTVIRPNGSLDATLDRHGLSDEYGTVRVLGFPKQLFEFDVEIGRPLLENRETSMSVTVDLLTGTCRRNDIYPDRQSRSLSSASLLDPRVDRETAVDTAHSFVRRKINRRYMTFTAPTIESVRDEVVFKLFWIVPTASSTTVHVLDTITNQLTAEDVTVDEFTSSIAPTPCEE